MNIPWGIPSHPVVNPYNPYDPQHSLVCPSLYGLLSLTNFKIVTALDSLRQSTRTVETATALCINYHSRDTSILELHSYHFNQTCLIILHFTFACLHFLPLSNTFKNYCLDENNSESYFCEAVKRIVMTFIQENSFKLTGGIRREA